MERSAIRGVRSRATPVFRYAAYGLCTMYTLRTSNFGSALGGTGVLGPSPNAR